MKKTTLKKNASFKNVFTILHQLTLTPFELGLMMSLVTKMMKRSRYDNQAKDYYLPYHPKDLATSDVDSWPKIQKSFKDFQAKKYITVKDSKQNGPQLFFNFIKVVK